MCLSPGQSFKYALIRVAHVVRETAWKSKNPSDALTRCEVK